MLRGLGWIAGFAALLWVCAHFAVWRLAGQLALIGALAAWVLIGAALMSKRLKRQHPPRPRPELSPLEIAARAARQECVNRYGEECARELENIDPQQWIRAAAYRQGAK